MTEKRPGPRPLALHLATANLILLSSFAVWPSARRVSPLWNPQLQARLASLVPALASVDPTEFAAALQRVAVARLTAMTGGLLRYRGHEWRRDLPDPPAVWQEGGSRILAYAEDGMPLLLVPSLVNRGYVLDLATGQSFARWLAGQGFRPFLFDWGDPGETELRFDLTAYIARLNRGLAHVKRLEGRSPQLLGYCMGGNLALAAAVNAPGDVAALALLATPWDFHAGGAHQAALVRSLAPGLAPPPVTGDLPPPPMDVDILQGFFWALDPLTALKKFTHFATLDQSGDAARRFVAMEDWLNDGVPLANAVARECLEGWYGNNTPVQGRWLIGGRPVLPQDWKKPALVVLPERDRLVPRESAAALLAQMPQAEKLEVPSGHIGMMVGPRAEAGLWQPLAAWVRLHQGTEQGRSGRRMTQGRRGTGKTATKVQA